MSLLSGCFSAIFGLSLVSGSPAFAGGSGEAGSNIPGTTIIPKPEQIREVVGSFVFTPKTEVVWVAAGRGIPFPIEQFVAQLRAATGYRVALQKVKTIPERNVISFEYVQDGGLENEGYRIDVEKDRIRVRANSDAGHLYAAQTLLQMLPPEAFGATKASGLEWRIPCVSIQDKPRFPWRGLMLDVSRHFFPKEFIKTCIDMLVMHKMNIFHWHLTDDQGWRIEIKKYPLLTRTGAWRVDREDKKWDAREPQREGEKATYGGFYTQEEIKEIVAYATRRNVTIVPEIEMPAHTTAVLVAYPRLSCSGGPFTVPPGGVWPISDIYCAGNDSAFAFLQEVLGEVIDLFPGKYIHIGGDEADKSRWKVCPKCQARIKREGLKDESELQSYFVKRIEKFLVSKNRRLIGWDEILEGGLAPEATVMSWRGMEGGIAAARMGHDVVMSPGSHCYLNAYQGIPELEPPAGGGLTTLSKVLEFEPVPDSLTSEQATHILGGQANIWTEYIGTPDHAQYMILPRLAAMAEVLWSPKEVRNRVDFIPRLEQQLRRYKASKYTFAKSLYLVAISAVRDSLRKGVRVALSTETGTAGIRYTLDGSEPTVRAPEYTWPFIADRTMKIKAVSFKNGKPISKASTQEIIIHKGAMKPVALKYRYDKYTGGGDFALTNGIRGTKSYSDGNWQGYEQHDLEAILDLGETMPVTRVTTSFLQNTASWIFYPTLVEYAVSEDGKTFAPVGRFETPVPGSDQEISTKELTQSLTAVKARFIKVSAKNVGICPGWHAGRGEKAWLFVDEIVVE